MQRRSFFAWLAAALLTAATLLLAARGGQASPVPASNLLTNPGFESGSDPWTSSGGQFVVSSAQKHGGCCAAAVSNSGGRGWSGVAQDVPITPLAAYRAGGWTLVADALNTDSAWLRIEWLAGGESAGPGCFSSLPPSTAIPAWRQWPAAQCAAPSNATHARIRAQIYAKNQSTLLGYIDDLSFILSAPPPPTATPTSPPTPTGTATATAIPTLTATASRTPPRSPTVFTATRTATAPPTRTTTPTSTRSVTATPTQTPALAIVINEVEYNSLSTGAEALFEWFELYNPSAQAATLIGWTIADNLGSDTLPDLVLPAGGFAVVAAQAASFRQNYPTFTGLLVELGQAIGNGLANTGDRLILRDVQGSVIDALSWGSDRSVFDPPCPLVSAKGYSLERVPAGHDTDQAADFQEQNRPSPGQPWFRATVTATPTPSATPTPTGTPTETATAPATATPTDTRTATATETETSTPTATSTVTAAAADTSTVTATATATPTDTSTVTSTETSTPTVTSTAPGAATATRTATEVPTVSPTATRTATAVPTVSPTVTDTSTPTATATATEAMTATATVTPTQTATATSTRTATPSATDTASPSATPQVRLVFLPLIVRDPVPTPTPTATPDPRLVSLNEFLPSPDNIDWNGDGKIDSGDEWIELHNAGAQPVDVSGWALDDEENAGSPLYFLPAGTLIPARGFLLLFGKETGLNLANTRDALRLLHRTGAVLEEYRYYSTWRDRSFSKTVDGGQEWTFWYPPSPGQPNLP